jgi:uncharacterized Zn-binding protein involved in type VI secretion
MPGIVRDSGQDVSGGANIQGSGSVLANNKPVVRKGDLVAGHGREQHAGPVMVGASGNVFADNKPVCRAGDIASCGHPANGSSNVFVN